MAGRFRATHPLNHRRTGHSRITMTSVENDEAAYTTWAEERRIDSNDGSITSSSVPPARFPSEWHSERPPPPPYDELYPPAHVPESRRTAKPRLSPPKGMDPLVAAMWHNENLSLLHSLPDHLLLKIIAMLSNTGIECIRRVARKFPPLCVREIFSPLRGSDARLSETGPLHWPRFGNTTYQRP